MSSKRAWLVAVCLVACVLCLFGCKAQRTYGEFSYFEDGRIQTKTFDELRDMEMKGKDSKEMAWRWEPVLIVQKELKAYVPELRDQPTETELYEQNGWEATKVSFENTTVDYAVITSEKNRLVVSVKVNDTDRATAELKRPVGYWWYVTAFDYEM